VQASNEHGSKFFELDARLPEPIRHDLIDRVAAHACFKGIIINAQYLSGRVTENEWKNDFIIPPHLVAGNLIKYKETYGNSHEIRDSYGLLNNKFGGMKPHEIRKIKQHLSGNRSDIKIIVKGIMCVEDAMAALEFGADCIYVSNGSHQKAWSAPSTINVLKKNFIGRQIKISYG